MKITASLIYAPEQQAEIRDVVSDFCSAYCLAENTRVDPWDLLVSSGCVRARLQIDGTFLAHLSIPNADAFEPDVEGLADALAHLVLGPTGLRMIESTGGARIIPVQNGFQFLVQ
jgi:hypothetical protein